MQLFLEPTDKTNPRHGVQQGHDRPHQDSPGDTRAWHNALLEPQHGGNMGQRTAVSARSRFLRRGPLCPFLGATALVILLAFLGACGGCRKAQPARPVQANPEDVQRRTNEAFVYAIQTISQLGEYSSDEAFLQAMDRLDQWVRQQSSPPDWKIDALAAPLVELFGEFSSKIRPIHNQLTEPRTLLELKAIARQLERAPERLEALGQRRKLEDLEALGQRYEQVLKEIEGAVRQGGDAAQREEVEARIVEAFFKRVKDPARQAQFKELLAVASWLDDPSRLKEFVRLAELAARLETLVQRPDARQWPELVAEFEDTAQRFLRGGPPTKLVIEVRFLLEQMADLARMQDYVELVGLERVLDTLAERLRIAANRAGRDDLRDLARRFAAAGRDRDLPQLQNLEKELLALAQPYGFADLARLEPQLKAAAEGLAAVGSLATTGAQKTGLDGLKALGTYCQEAGKRIAQAVEDMKALSASAASKEDPQARTARLNEISARFEDLAQRVELMDTEFEYLAGAKQHQFYSQDQAAMREAVFLRDLSRWARGEEFDDISRARRLFDWVVRNIQLEASPRPASGVVRVPQYPLETLFLGRGTAAERAWVFILLARQQGIDAAMLAVPDASSPGGEPRPWAVGVLSEGEIYLFDTQLGLPIPARDGVTRSPSGELEVRPATLAEAARDESILRQLDLSSTQPYPVRAGQLDKVVVLLEASPSYLSLRMKLVEGQLSGDDRMVLSASPAAQAERFKTCKQVGQVRLWPHPYQTLLVRLILGPDLAQWQTRAFAAFQAPSLVEGKLVASFIEEPVAPLFLKATPKQSEQVERRRRTTAERRREAPPPTPLGQGRVLHLRGKLQGEGSASHYYQMARPSERELALHGQLSAAERAIILEAKQNASYWLGLLAQEQKNYSSAIDYLATRTLSAFPGTPWTPGAKYNLARVFEVQGQALKAAQLYRENADAPQGYGDLLRAKWLERLAGVAEKKPPPKVEMELPGLPELPEPKPAAKPAKK